MSTNENWRSPADVIEPELLKGERLLWADRPISVKAHFLRALPMFLFGIPFLAFALFWTGLASSMSNPRSGSGPADMFGSIFPLFGIPFILVGVGLLVWPLFSAFRQNRTVYAVTDQRLIIREDILRPAVRSWPLSQAETMERVGDAQGPGTVYFTEKVQRTSKGGTYTEKIGFIGIDQPKRLEELIRSEIAAFAKRSA